MNIAKYVAAVAVAAAMIAPALAATPFDDDRRVCPAPMKVCGDWNHGGLCYYPGRTYCTNGFVCGIGLVGCPAGPKGKGGCYKPSTALCDAGQIVSIHK